MAGTLTHRDSRFSMSAMTPLDVSFATAASKHIRAPVGKRLERQLIHLWKILTRSRSKKRASFVPTDFISVTSRRRSTMPPLPRVRV